MYFFKISKIIIMRFTLIFTLCCVVISMATATEGKSQTKKETNISLSLNNASVVSVIEAISKETGYEFNFDEVYLSQMERITIRLRNATLQEALQKLANQTGLRFRKIDDVYFVSHVAELAKADKTEAKAQPGLSITGTVFDSTTGETLPGASVSVKGTMVGSATDINGNFSIRAQRGAWLVFSFVGYDDYEYLVTEMTDNLKVFLSESTQAIEEVVVTAIGTQRKISTLAAVATIDPKDLQVPATSVANLLGGRVAGVFSMQTSGEPGKNLAEFWIRGVGTFGANASALVLIDGIEGDINSIDPADIESFSVLKDASATAVYGVRGANGVVLITTKRGESGKLSISGRMNYTLSHLSRLPDYLRAYDYALLANEAREVRGEAPLYNDIQLKVIKNGLDPDFYPDISWQDEIVRHLSFRQSYYVNGRGGSDVARYFVSLGGSSESAAYKVEKNNPNASNAGYNTYSFRVNLDINLSKTTVLKFSSDAFMSINNRPGDIESTDYIWNSQAMLTPLIYPLRYSNGQFPSTNIPGFTSAGISPYVVINHTGKTKLTGYNSKATMSLEQDLKIITEGLKINILGSYDRNGGYTETRYHQPALYLATGRSNRGELITRQSVAASTHDHYGLYARHNRQYRRYLLEATMNYDRVFDSDHRVGGLAKFYIDDEFSTVQSYDNEMSGLTLSYAQIPRRYVRVTGRIGYGFRDTYMIDFNFGYTGTENFMPGRQYGFFPSIALGWVPSSYDWVKDNMSWVNLFKIRGSYGTVGNDRIGGRRFPYLDRISQSNGSVWGSLSSVEKILVTRVGADNLVWESAKKTNVGVEARLFSDAFAFTVDLFNDLRDGIFQERVQVPGYAGLTNNPYGNVGSMVSWGTDGNASYTHKVSKDMSLTIRGNYTWSQNKILNYEKLFEEYPYKEYNGLPNGLVRGYQCLGFFSNEADIAYSPKQNWGAVMPGDLKYKDINGDGVINADDMVPVAYPHNWNSMFPRLTYGFGGQFNYKNLSLGVLFQGVGRQDYLRNNVGYIPFNGQGVGNVLSQFSDPSVRWIPRWYAEANGIDTMLAENPNALLPLLQYGQNTNNTQPSDFWRADARYLRLKEITLNYNVRGMFLKRIGIASVDLQLVGNNLYVWDKVKVFDPEQAQRQGRVYPIPSTYSLQLFINL